MSHCSSGGLAKSVFEISHVVAHPYSGTCSLEGKPSKTGTQGRQRRELSLLTPCAIQAHDSRIGCTRDRTPPQKMAIPTPNELSLWASLVTTFPGSLHPVPGCLVLPRPTQALTHCLPSGGAFQIPETQVMQSE